MKKFLCIISFATLLFAAVSATARERYALSEEWQFFFSSENSSDAARRVNLPHLWQSDIRRSGEGVYTEGNYVRRMFIPSSWHNKRLFLRFYGVQTAADVFLNGTYIGSHHGAWTAFTFEITDFVLLDKDNTLLVTVGNSPRNDILPTSTELELSGGITRPVELIVTERTTISPTYYSTDGVLLQQQHISAERAECTLKCYIAGKQDSQCSVWVNLIAPDGYSAFSRTVKYKIDNNPLSVPITLEQPALWSPSTPALYTVEVAVGADTVRCTTGLRSIDVSSKDKLCINGGRCLVNGVTLRHDRTASGEAPDTADYRADMALVRELGATAIRCQTAPFAAPLLDECDRNGTLVWIDIPFTGTSFLSDIPYVGSNEFRRNGTKQLREIIMQNYNRPSVVMWGIFSLLRDRGGDMLGYIRSLNIEAKALDASRPTVACSNQDGEINFITDLIVWQQNIGWGSGQMTDLTDWQSALSKNWNQLRQAVCYGECNPRDVQRRQTTPRTDNTPYAQRQSVFHEGYASQLTGGSLFWGTWLHSMFDYNSSRYNRGVRRSGVVCIDHTTKKDIFYLYRALWNHSDTTLHIAARNRELYSRDKNRIKVYSSVDKPALTVNGKNIAVERIAPCIYLSADVTLADANIISVSVGSRSDSWQFRLGNTLTPLSPQVPRTAASPAPTN